MKEYTFRRPATVIWYDFTCPACGQAFRLPGGRLGGKRSIRYCSNPCRIAALQRAPRPKKDNGTYRALTPRGYIRIIRGGRQVMEHRWVMEQTLGRPLTREERVHHVNGDRTDNRKENLVLCATQAEHLLRFHPENPGKAARARWERRE